MKFFSLLVFIAVESHLLCQTTLVSCAAQIALQPLVCGDLKSARHRTHRTDRASFAAFLNRPQQNGAGIISDLFLNFRSHSLPHRRAVALLSPLLFWFLFLRIHFYPFSPHEFLSSISYAANRSLLSALLRCHLTSLFPSSVLGGCCSCLVSGHLAFPFTNSVLRTWII